MHEMSIATQLIEIAVDAIPDELKGSRVERINLRVGKLANVVNESLTFCFEIAAKETPLEGAELVIDTIPVEARCRECSHNWTVNEPVFRCASCNSGDVEILSGQELDISSLEIEE